MFVDDDKDSEEENVDNGAGAELRAGELSYKPLFIISSRIERSTLTKRLCVAIRLPLVLAREILLLLSWMDGIFYSLLYDGQSL